MDEIKLKAELTVDPVVLNWHTTGSREICNPPPTTTDFDIVVEVNPSKLDEWLKKKEEDGWKLESKKYTGTKFFSLRKNEFNLIVSQFSDFYDDFVLATKTAKSLNLLKKEDRITLFHAIMDRKPPDEYQVTEFEW